MLFHIISHLSGFMLTVAALRRRSPKDKGIHCEHCRNLPETPTESTATKGNLPY